VIKLTFYRVVEQNLTSAVIFEDDVDWDLRIKQQLYDFALSSRALVQPLAKEPSTYADPTFPVVLDPHLNTRWMDFDHMTATKPPTITPYGDKWDILWLGHCGMRRPVATDEKPWGSISRPISKGLVFHLNDDTTPEPRSIHVWDDPSHPEFRNDFAPHTRVTHHAMDGICTLAYAVSQAGARKLLYELGIWKMEDTFDMSVRQFCDGIWGHERHICLTVQPTLFSHYTPKPSTSEKETWNIRWSTRMNLPKLLKGETDFNDQWPDLEKP